MKNSKDRTRINNARVLVSIVIVTRNGLPLLRQCLNSLNEENEGRYEIIVVDNASDDETVHFLKSSYRPIIIVESKTNAGFALGNNMGYQRAKGKYILFLNNDTILTKGCIGALVERIQSDDHIGAVQPKILRYPKSCIVDSIGSYFIPTGFLYHEGHNKKDRQAYLRESCIFSMKGACMLIRRDVIETVGLFNPSYFAYFEETDLCQRIWIAGYKVMYTPAASIFHMGGETAKKLPSSFVLFHSYKNRIFTYCKNLELSTLASILPLHILLCLFIAGVYLSTLHIKDALALYGAIFWNILHFPEIVKERKFIRSIRKISDRDYLPLITRRVRPAYYYHLHATSLAGYDEQI